MVPCWLTWTGANPTVSFERGSGSRKRLVFPRDFVQLRRIPRVLQAGQIIQLYVSEERVAFHAEQGRLVSVRVPTDPGWHRRWEAAYERALTRTSLKRRRRLSETCATPRPLDAYEERFPSRSVRAVSGGLPTLGRRAR